MADERKALFDRVDQVIAELQHLDRLCDAQAAAIVIESDVDAHMRKYMIGDIDVAPADARPKVLAVFKERWDEYVTAKAPVTDTKATAIDAEVERHITASRLPAVVPNSDQREQHVLRKLEGVTLDRLTAAYAAGDPVLDRLVEIDGMGDPADLRRLFRLSAGADDVHAVQRFQSVRNARRAAREDAEAIAKLDELRAARPMRLAHFTREAKAGRPVRVARAPVHADGVKSSTIQG